MSEEFRNLERLIVESRNKFRALVDGIEDEMMSIDSAFRIIVLNKRLADSLGRHPRDIVGQLCYQVVYGFDRPCPDMGWPCPAVRSRETGLNELVCHDRYNADSQTNQTMEIRSMPVFNVESSSDVIILSRRNITQLSELHNRYEQQQKELEAEILDRTRRLFEANEKLTRQRNALEAANEDLLQLQVLKEDLTNMVVHDLKSPLAEIQANLETVSYTHLTLPTN